MKKPSSTTLSPRSSLETVLSSNLLSYNVCSYLCKEDVLHLSSVTREVYQAMNDNSILAWIILSKENEK